MTFVESRFASPENPYTGIEWEERDAVLGSFEQKEVEVPTSWSQDALNIVAQKYFTGSQDTGERETSVAQMIDRVCDTIADWGVKHGYFSEEDSDTFSSELKNMIATQKASFNSPVWFNIGVKYNRQQPSACYILSVDDSMDSILEWYKQEGMIFKFGSGAGVNLSNLRGNGEGLTGGGEASGPVSFMRGADASAGSIKSGGRTRRAAKLVCLDIDHPDIEEFIWCKKREEEKQRVLQDAGYDMSMGGADSYTIQYQNANNSVRVNDKFMKAVENGDSWNLIARYDGSVTKRMDAGSLLEQIAEASWNCADPGVQYDDIINDWHTTPKAGRINATNPCSEYCHLDNSSCNLASLNLKKFYENGDFLTEDFIHAIKILFTAQDILICEGEYPTEQITENTRNYRQIGIGYTNLGALLMSMGIPYESKQGTDLAAAITSLMTGTAYAQSGVLADTVGPFEDYQIHKEDVVAVLQKHRSHAYFVRNSELVDRIMSRSIDMWDDAVEYAKSVGVRNSQASVLAPTGTISFMMDADTLGIEPDFSLIKEKTLVGGGKMQLINRSVSDALRCLGYQQDQVDKIVDYLHDNYTIYGAPGLRKEHYDVFACAVGKGSISTYGHINMMAAVQPFLSGSISKTVNMPEESTVTDIKNVYVDAWRMGIKAIAIYRDGSKVAQPLSTKKHEQPITNRKKLDKKRTSRTYSFRVGESKGYLTVGEYPDGSPGEIFVKLGKQGSTLAGFMDAFAVSVSVGLQYGVPLEDLIAKYLNVKFEPAGITDDPEIRFSASIVDYIARRMAIDYLPEKKLESLGIPTSNGEKSHAVDTNTESMQNTEVICSSCGSMMIQAGSCYACASCGSTTGCS